MFRAPCAKVWPKSVGCGGVYENLGASCRERCYIPLLCCVRLAPAAVVCCVVAMRNCVAHTPYNVLSTHSGVDTRANIHRNLPAYINSCDTASAPQHSRNAHTCCLGAAAGAAGARYGWQRGDARDDASLVSWCYYHVWCVVVARRIVWRVEHFDRAAVAHHSNTDTSTYCHVTEKNEFPRRVARHDAML